MISIKYWRQTWRVVCWNTRSIAMKAVISRAMTICEDGTKRSFMLADVKTAFQYGDARRSLYVELPPEKHLSASGRYVGKLERAMYGTRKAPMIWQDHLRKTLLDMKFKESAGSWSPICSTGTSSICTYGKTSMMCSTVPPPVAAPQKRGVGRGASTSPSSNKLKHTVLAALGRGVFWALFISPSSVSLELSGGCSRQGPWRRLDARAVAAV